MRKRTSIAAAVLVAAGVAVWLLWSAKAVAPVYPHLFYEEWSFLRLEENRPVEDHVSLPQDTGFYVELAFSPNADRPGVWKQRAVAPDPNLWPVQLALYPAGDDPDGDKAVQNQFKNYREPDFSSYRGRGSVADSSNMPPIACKEMTFGPRGSRNPPPPTVATWGEDEFRGWAYFGYRWDKTPPAGEYVYEIRVYPTAKWVSGIRCEYGEPVVVRRGRLTIEGAS